MQHGNGGSDRQAAEFADALANLKQRGCMLLVAGTDHDAADAACARLLGDAVSEPRRRLLVAAGDGPERTTTAAAGSPTRTIAFRRMARSASAEDAGAPSTTPTRSVVGDPGDVHEAIVDETAALEPTDRPFEPSELRVCVDDGAELVATNGEEPVFRFCHALSGHLRDHRGMGHVHVSAPYDSETVARVEPLFDAVIEVREGPRQRWHLRDADISTDWLSL